MILLTLLMSCQTEPTTPEPAPVEAEAEPETTTQTISLGQRPPPKDIEVVLPDMTLSPELEAVTVHLLAKENEQARTALDAWLIAHPADADAWFLRGESWMTELNWGSADTDFQKAIEADTNHIHARKRQIGAQIGLRKCDNALGLIETYQTLVPEDPEPLMMRSFCKKYANDHDGSLADMVLACEKGYEPACAVVPRLEARLEWIRNKQAEMEAAKPAEGDTPTPAPEPVAPPTEGSPQ